MESIIAKTKLRNHLICRNPGRRRRVYLIFEESTENKHKDEVFMDMRYRHKRLRVGRKKEHFGTGQRKIKKGW